LSYASLSLSVSKPISTVLSENLTTAYEAVKRTRAVIRGLPHFGHSRHQHHRKSLSGLCPPSCEGGEGRGATQSLRGCGRGSGAGGRSMAVSLKSFVEDSERLIEEVCCTA